MNIQIENKEIKKPIKLSALKLINVDNQNQILYYAGNWYAFENEGDYQAVKKILDDIFC